MAGPRPTAGARRKPTAILKLEEGKFYASKHQDRGGEPIACGVPKKPADLPEYAKEHWDFIVPHLVGMGVAKEADTPALIELCLWWDQKVRLMANPEGSNFNKALNASKQWLNYASRFGLTPSDRARIDIRDPNEKQNPTKRHLA